MKEQRGFNSIIKIMFLTKKNFSFNFYLISTWILLHFLMYIPHIHDITDIINVIRIYDFYNMISWNISLSVIYFKYFSLSLIVCGVVVFQSLSHVRLCGPRYCSALGFTVLHYLPEFAQTHVHWVSDAFQLPHPLSPPLPLSLNLSQNQGLFQ